MAVDLEKYRKQPTTTGGVGPTPTPTVDINKYRKAPVVAGPTFDIPQDPAKASQQRLQQYQSEQGAYDKEAGKGFFSRFGKALVSNLAPSQVGLGKSLAGILYQGSKADQGLQESIAQGEDIKVNLAKEIAKNEQAGLDTTRLKQAYNDLEKTTAGSVKTARDLVQLPSTAKVAGQLGGTALDVLTAGTYGKAKTGAMSTGKLFSGSAPAVKTLATAAGAPELGNLAGQQARGLFSRQGAANIAKGAIPGYASDVTLGLQGERGEDREGAAAFIPGLGTALGAGIPALSEATQTVKNIRNPEPLIVEKRLSGLKDLETKNGKVARVFEAADRKGVDVRKTLSETNLLNGAIDADGRISSDKALNNFNEFIQPWEGKVKEALQTEGRSIQLNQLADDAIDFIDNSKLSDRQKVELQKEIADNLDAFKQFRGKSVPVASVHDTKVVLANANNYLNPGKNIVDKEAARFFKEVVEKNTSSMDVAKYNKELSKYYTVREALEAMDRAVVSGGRMGKYFSSLIGSGVGGLAGGPVGAIVGAEAGAKVRSGIMSRAFGSDIQKGLEVTPELTGALRPVATGKAAIPELILGRKKPPIGDIKIPSFLKGGIPKTKLQETLPSSIVGTKVNSKLEAFKAGKGSMEGGYIANPLVKTPANNKVNNQVVSSVNDNISLVEQAKKLGVSEGGNKTLVALHNTTSDKLKFMNEIGGMANPSIAIAKPDTNLFENFGDITLLADADFVFSPKAKTFAADVYSPRFPNVNTTVKDWKQWKSALDKFGIPDNVIDTDDVFRNIKYSSEVEKAFKNQSTYKTLDDFIDAFVEEAGVQKRIFLGFTNSGKRKYLTPITAEKVSKLMNQEATRGGERSFYGLPNIRAQVTPQFKSIPAIKKAESRIVKKEDFEIIKEQYSNEFNNILNEAERYYIYDVNHFGVSDEIGQAIGQYISGNKKALNEILTNYPNTFASKLDDFAIKLAAMPTEYFETKFNRPVMLSEFRYAAIPENTPETTKELLRKQGITFEEYKPGEGNQTKAVKKLAAEKGLMFGLGALGYYELQQDE